MQRAKRRPTTVNQLSLIFKDLDQDADGVVHAQELHRAAHRMGVPIDENVAELMIQRYHGSRTGGMTLEEFLDVMVEREKEIEGAFFEIQRRKSRNAKSPDDLTPDDLRPLLTALNMKISDEQLRKFVKLADRDCDGRISMEEFRAFVVFLPNANPRACFDALRGRHFEAADGHLSPAVDDHRQHGKEKSLFKTLGEKLVAAGVAGACSRTATAPIDRLKTIMQNGGASNGIVGGLRDIHTEGGMQAFFRGNGANCVKIVPETAVKFIAFDALTAAIAQEKSCPTVAERFVAGGAAGALAQASIYPLEIGKCRLALAPPGLYSGLVRCLGDISTKEGVRGLYAGLGASLVGIVPYAAIDLAVNSVLKEEVSRRYDKSGGEPGVATLLGCGMASSSIAMSVTYPLNVVRTRLQAMGLPGATKYDGPLDVVRKVVAKDGYLGLYRGIVPNMMKVLPATSISYTLFDRVKHFFDP